MIGLLMIVFFSFDCRLLVNTSRQEKYSAKGADSYDRTEAGFVVIKIHGKTGNIWDSPKLASR